MGELAHESDVDELRKLVSRTLSGTAERPQPRGPKPAEAPTQPLTWEQRVAAAVQNAPELADAIRTARESVDAASRCLAELDLPADAQNKELWNKVHSRSPEAKQSLAETVRDWKGRLERGRGPIEPVVDHLGAAIAALDDASELRRAAESPGWLPVASYDLDDQRKAIQIARRTASAVVNRVPSDISYLREFAQADAAAPQWREDITPAVSSFGYTQSLHSEVKSRLNDVSSRLGQLVSKLEISEPPAPPAEQDLRLRASGQAAPGRGQMTDKQV